MENSPRRKRLSLSDNERRRSRVYSLDPATHVTISNIAASNTRGHQQATFANSTDQRRFMRIGITCYPTYGGSGVVATELGTELAARGHDVHFISYAPPIRMNPNDPHIHFHEVEVTSYPLFDHPPYTLALATKRLEVFESQALDLLHVHYAIPHSVSAMLARSMAAPRRLPFITTLH